jgi:hypothetical protein
VQAVTRPVRPFQFTTYVFTLAVGLSIFWGDAAQIIAQPKYESHRAAKIPTTVHVVRVPRKDHKWELESVHALGKAIGLAKVTAQLEIAARPEASPVVAINGDFYVRRGDFAGDARGLQIMKGELLSAPTGSASFWIDAVDQPHIGETISTFRVSWPDGSSAKLGLNSERAADEIVLYTPAAGSSIPSSGGTEIVLERDGNAPWLPLRVGKIYQAKVRRVQKTRPGENSAIDPEVLVLSVGPKAAVPRLAAGDLVRISTETQPALRGVSAAISGGPILVKDRKRQAIKVTEDSDSYVFSSMRERHPRSAIGWNDEYYFLVSVDGRQKGVSVGMTLDEFATELVKLGCDYALNVDGGGSSTLWFDGKVRNYLCDGYERDVANALVVVEKKSPVRK